MNLNESSVSGYFYGEEAESRRPGAEALNALRRYRMAEFSMRRRASDAMKLNETDVLAVRFLIAAQRAKRDISPKDIAAHLQISSASTTALVNRLVASGHVERRPHLSDGRAIVLVATASAHREVRSTFGELHERMSAVADSLSEYDARIVVDFIDRMRDVLDTTERG